MSAGVGILAIEGDYRCQARAKSALGSPKTDTVNCDRLPPESFEGSLAESGECCEDLASSRVFPARAGEPLGRIGMGARALRAAAEPSCATPDCDAITTHAHHHAAWDNAARGSRACRSPAQSLAKRFQTLGRAPSERALQLAGVWL